MKRKLFRLSLVLATVLILFAGCGKDDFDEDMLIGTWKTSTWTYHFLDDYSGSRDRGGITQNFTWDLYGDELELRVTQYDESESSITTYVTFIIESLSETKMEAYDKNDSSKSTITFTKQ